MKDDSLFVFGCGYAATRLVQQLRKASRYILVIAARLLLARGWQRPMAGTCCRLKHVCGTCRTAEGTGQLQRQGIVPYLYSPAEGLSLR